MNNRSKRWLPKLILLLLALLCACNSRQTNKPYAEVTDVDYKSLLEPMLSNSIRIDRYSAEEIPVGFSKLGGLPDLPADFSWYYYEGAPYGGETVNRPLSFLAQLNCAEMHEHDTESLLPSTGMLYFFYELETSRWGFDPKDKGSARVFYYSGDASTLIRTSLPEDLAEDYRIPEQRICFSAEPDLPDFEEFIEWHDAVSYSQFEGYDNAKEKLLVESDSGEVGKVLGYADIVQNGMLLECELASNGVYCGEGLPIQLENRERHLENMTKWRLLFQLESLIIGDYHMYWGDVGRLYFYIHLDDLQAQRYENCWMILQCS